ncbi:MAG TPA: hypothetical protein VE978_03055 [Chitinophagales bacterium]|nr:hypothetical protein [Chitinophagales bacterium]
MSSLLKIWKENNDFFKEKSFSQIINISGKGELRDGNQTSLEVRELLNEIPTKALIHFADQCLNESFKDGGLALQDVMNQYGKRLGFNIENGLYRGKKSEIGFDGIWTIKNDHDFIVEIKTTDAYRINLDTIADYRQKLIEGGRLANNSSSILIIVGRQDTGDLEAQIRGSKHAWIIRLLSIDALTKLLELRETVSDIRVLKQINETLKPLEYTRLDRLIDLIFITSQDTQLAEEIDVEAQENVRKKNGNSRNHTERETPVNYHDACVQKISHQVKKTFIKQSKSTYQSSDGLVGLTCAVSKVYPSKDGEHYWYAFHPFQKEFLDTYENGFVSFGCGSEQYIIMMPFKNFLPLTKFMRQTVQENKYYWHVKIHKKDGRFEIEQPLNKKEKRVNVTQFLVK